MPRIFENEIVYNHSPVHTINWLHRKYPNPYATHVVSVDTVERTVDPETGIMRSERVIGVKQSAPGWITKLFALPPVAYVREIIFVDPDRPSATCMSVNLNLATYIACLELIRYSPLATGNHSALPLSPATDTLFHQRAIMNSGFSTAMIARRIEKASVDRFRTNASVGQKGFEWVLSDGSKQDPS